MISIQIQGRKSCYLSFIRLTRTQSIIATAESTIPLIPNPMVIIANGRLKYLVALNKCISISPDIRAINKNVNPGTPYMSNGCLIDKCFTVLKTTSNPCTTGFIDDGRSTL